MRGLLLGIDPIELRFPSSPCRPFQNPEEGKHRNSETPPRRRSHHRGLRPVRLPRMSGLLLGIDPVELRFPFELNKRISCTLQLTNKTDRQVVFKVMMKRPEKFLVRPWKGMVAPRSIAYVVVTVKAQDMPPDMPDKFLVRSAIVAKEIMPNEITGDMFTRESGNIVDEVKFKAVYVAPSSSQSAGFEVGNLGSLSYQEGELNILERIVIQSQEPGYLDLPLLYSITENFSEKKKIGSGGCGTVYKGILRNGAVAVKRLYSSHTIKDKMFHREVISLISVKHENIVRFLGYCSLTKEHAITFEGTTIMADIRERLLCFEYIRNGSLDKHLSDELTGLEWQTRYQIIIGICRGLYYLHKDKEIIHMDLKPGNILIDDLMVPKITDFGLSRLENDVKTRTTRFISHGYTAPEYISGGKPTSKSDIYSLGVIIIELVTGSRAEPSITKVIRRWNHRWIKSKKQSSLGYQQVKKCLELALRCIQDDPENRPDISDIIDELEEIDTTDDQTQIQMEDILGIEPLEIRVPFQDFKASHSVELTNDTDDYIAFVTKAKLERFCAEPDRGIVPPRSKCSVTLVMEAQVNAQPNKHYTEVITVLSTRVDDGALATMDLVTAGDIFIESEGKVVDEVNVTVVFGTQELPEEQ